jgi:di/tricarboxylate transporter
MVELYGIWIVLGSLAVLVFLLYQDVIEPTLSFLLVIGFMILVGVLPIKDFLNGFANEQILTIILLVMITAELRKNFDVEKLFDRIFVKAKSRKGFLIRMMAFASFSSAFINNTPIVAVMIPYVYNWTKSRGYHPSKFLIPLSFSTILGGMITVIGTSTNMVLNGLIAAQGSELLDFDDFLIPGLAVTLMGWAYLYTFGYRLLPAHKEAFNDARSKANEYLVETFIGEGSKLIGQKISESGITSLKGVYLVEIIRSGETYQDFMNGFIFEEGDTLLFMGKTDTIVSLINADIGFSLPERRQGDEIVEAIIPFGSMLNGALISEVSFREKYDADVLAVHRNGQKLKGKLSQKRLMSGDLLLLSAGKNFMNNFESFSDLYVIATAQKKVRSSKSQGKIFWVIVVGLIISLAMGYISLFMTSAAVVLVMMFMGMISPKDLSKSVDLELFLVLVCALGIGSAMLKTGAASFLALNMISLLEPYGSIAILSGLLISVILLTSIVTNVAAVSIAFPIAYSLSQKLGIDPTPFYIAIAFGASGDFITPIGYQTNLMVMGPGNYKFSDFTKVGFPFAIIYFFIVLLILILRYKF